MSDTTIAISDETKALLDEHKQPSESYNDVVKRLAGNPDGELWTEDEIVTLINEHSHE